MRRAVILLLLSLLVSCGDPGLRDRSLMTTASATDVAIPRTPAANTARPSTSVIGLLPDPLAPLYPDGAALIVRFDDLDSLGRNALPMLMEMAKALPELAPGAGSASALLRQALLLAETTPLQTTRPFALVPTPHGWAAIVPVVKGDLEVDHLKQLDAHYCVTGNAEVVAAYEAGFRKGFYLPGDMSLLVDPAIAPRLGSLLAVALGEGLRVRATQLAFLDSFVAPLPADIERVDLAVRLASDGLRVDLRLAPNRESPTAFVLESLKPESSDAARWLPSDGTIYAELSTNPADLEPLLVQLLRTTPTAAPLSELRGARAIRGLLSALGSDAAAMLSLAPDGSGTIRLVSDIDKPTVTSTYFGSSLFESLMARIAGEGGHLEWIPSAFERHGVRVGAITGHISRTRLTAWRDRGVVLSTMSVLLRGPVVCYVAIAGEKLCIVVGQQARREMERFLDRVQDGAPADNDLHVAASTLFPYRLAAGTVNLAALFDGCREAAHYWHPEGRALKELSLRWRIPATAAVTVEGGALRCALRIEAKELAAAIAKIRTALNPTTDPK